MISEKELLDAVGRLQRDVLRQWIEAGLISPHHEAGSYVFDEIDVARVNLVCDLSYDMGLGHESLPVVLSLIDQLHRTRHSLRAFAEAIAEQPEEVRITITTRAQARLRRPADR